MEALQGLLSEDTPQTPPPAPEGGGDEPPAEAGADDEGEVDGQAEAEEAPPPAFCLLYTSDAADE